VLDDRHDPEPEVEREEAEKRAVADRAKARRREVFRDADVPRRVGPEERGPVREERHDAEGYADAEEKHEDPVPSSVGGEPLR
jgi:hypothetical protein